MASKMPITSAFLGGAPVLGFMPRTNGKQEEIADRPINHETSTWVPTEQLTHL